MLLHLFLFYVAERPIFTSHPLVLKDVVPGETAMFTAKAIGTEPLSYQWEWKPTMDDSEWHPCNVEKFTGEDSSTLTIPHVQKSIEGSYRCVVSNCAGNSRSKAAELNVGKFQFESGNNYTTTTISDLFLLS